MYEPINSSPTPSDVTVQSKQHDESLCVNSFLLRYIMAYHYEEYQSLEEVSKKISIQVKSKIERNLRLIIRDDVNKETFSRKVDKFIDFHRAQNPKMHQEEFPMQPKVRKDVISEARSKFSVLMDSNQKKDKITIHGEKEKVQEAILFLKSKVSDLSRKSKKDFGRSFKAKIGPNSPTGAAEKVIVENFSCVLSQNVKVAVYQGDITKERADVIVNPANEYLKHSSGAASAIVKAGGESIQVESDEIMRQRRHRSLTAGEVVVTKAGRLHCNLIIHAVSPRWANYYQQQDAKEALFSVAYNCLASASQNGASSISMPAIISENFGLPSQVCAEVLFAVAIYFAENASISNNLKNIRFVNIDKSTSQVFVQEMKKRFGSSVKKESVEMFHLNGTGRNTKQHQQSLSERSRQSPFTTAYEENHDSRPNIDNKSRMRSMMFNT